MSLLLTHHGVAAGIAIAATILSGSPRCGLPYGSGSLRRYG